MLPACVQVGDNFVLNCLGENEYNPILKHFLQVNSEGRARLPPGLAALRLA